MILLLGQMTLDGNLCFRVDVGFAARGYVGISLSARISIRARAAGEHHRARAEFYPVTNCMFVQLRAGLKR